MIVVRFLIIFLIVLSLYYVLIYRNLGPSKDEHAPEPVQTAMLYEGLEVYPFLCYIPKGYGAPGENYPLIVYLHDEAQSVEDGKEQALNQSPITHAVSQDEFPYLIAAPISGTDEWEATKLISFLNTLRQQFEIDPSRIYLTGFDDGADAVWMLSIFYPNRFAAIVPIAGTADPKAVRQNLTHLPVWIFHGKKDKVVPVENSLLLMGALKDHNENINYTLLQDKGHRIWEDVYHYEALYDWFWQFQSMEKVKTNDP